MLQFSQLYPPLIPICNIFAFWILIQAAKDKTYYKTENRAGKNKNRIGEPERTRTGYGSRKEQEQNTEAGKIKNRIREPERTSTEYGSRKEQKQDTGARNNKNSIRIQDRRGLKSIEKDKLGQKKIERGKTG